MKLTKNLYWETSYGLMVHFEKSRWSWICNKVSSLKNVQWIQGRRDQNVPGGCGWFNLFSSICFHCLVVFLLLERSCVKNILWHGLTCCLRHQRSIPMHWLESRLCSQLHACRAACDALSAPAIHGGHPNGALCSWPCPGPTLTRYSHFRVNQQREGLSSSGSPSLCHSAFERHKNKIWEIVSLGIKIRRVMQVFYILI